MNENLNWNLHLSSVCSKLSSAVGMMRRIAATVTPKALTMIYHAIITSRLSYMSLVWGTQSERIAVIKKKAIRIIHGAHYLSHTDPLFKSLGILKFEDLCKIALMKFYYKLKNNQLPIFYSNAKFISHEDVHHYDTRNKILLE